MTIYMGLPENSILCLPGQGEAIERSAVYMDDYQIIIAPMNAVRRVELTPDGGLGRFVYDGERSRQSWFTELDENVRLLLDKFRKQKVSEIITRRQIETN